MKNLNIARVFSKTAVFAFSLSILTLFIGCSSKNDENSPGKSEPCSTPAVPESNSPKAVSPQDIDRNEPNKEHRPIVSRKIIPADNTPSISGIMTELSYTATPTERKVELLESLNFAGMEQDPNVIGVVQKALEDPNADVGQAAIALLDGYESPAILTAVDLALKNNNEEIRQAAVDLLGNVESPQVGDLLALALLDTSEDIRMAAFDLVESQNDDVQLRILESAIASPYDDVKESVVSKLESMGDKKSVDVLINGLKDQNADFRQTVSNTLESLTEQKFDTFEKAQSWWIANSSKYDDDLALIGSE
jgi:hypothetical protein